MIVIEVVFIQNLVAPFCCPWERHGTALSPAWWSWQAALNYSHISVKLKNQNNKFQANGNILASPEAGRAYLMYSASVTSCVSGG